MDAFRAVVAVATKGAARSRPVTFLRARGARPIDGNEGERGQGLAEYALILGLIAIVAIVSLVFVGETIANLFWAPISEEFGEVLRAIGIGAA